METLVLPLPLFMASIPTPAAVIVAPLSFVTVRLFASGPLTQKPPVGEVGVSGLSSVVMLLPLRCVKMKLLRLFV